jgi:hypothetical protein
MRDRSFHPVARGADRLDLLHEILENQKFQGTLNLFLTLIPPRIGGLGGQTTIYAGSLLISWG